MTKATVTPLPGVSHIGVLSAAQLPAAVQFMAMAGQWVPVLADIRWLDFQGAPTCVNRTERVGAGTRQSCTLNFRSLESMTDIPAPRAYIAVTPAGRAYLIGCREQPEVVETVTQQTGTPGGEAAGLVYEITHTAVRTMVPCLIG